MLSKNKIKAVSKLHKSKYRKESSLFIAEGPKTVLDLFEEGVVAENLFALDNWYQEHKAEIKCEELFLIDPSDFKKITSLQTSNMVIGVFKQWVRTFELSALLGQWTIALDGVQDPGNLGTIIRLADWFGVKTIICSHHTVDLYNPKVVQSTMASISRVAVHYVDLNEVLSQIKGKLPIVSTIMDGASMYKTDFGKEGVLLMGNEGQGVSDSLLSLCSQNITIPKGNKASKIDSLNVAMATGIVLSEITRA